LAGFKVTAEAYSPLVAGLRPPTDLNPMNFLSFHLLSIYGMAEPEDEDARCVGVGKHRSVPRVLLIETGQMIQVRLVVGVDAVVADRSRQLDCLEELCRAPAGENSDSLCSRVDFVSNERNDSLHVPIETVTLGRTRRPRPGERFEFAMKIGCGVGRAPVLIRLSVQVDA
jgi:hypothetical protein